MSILKPLTLTDTMMLDNELTHDVIESTPGAMGMMFALMKFSGKVTGQVFVPITRPAKDQTTPYEAL